MTQIIRPKLFKKTPRHATGDVYMTSSLLGQSAEEAEWSWIKPNLQQGHVILVDSTLNLNEVGTAIAEDQSHLVQDWIKRSLLIKPTPEQISSWDSNPSKRFLFLIRQPYVLIQELMYQ